MSRSVQNIERVREALERRGVEARLQRFPESTRTAAEAARVVGCEVAQIAKSLLFRTKASGDAVLIVASGRNRVDLEKAAEAAGGELEMASPDFVRGETGFAIGGVPPLGHRLEIPVFLDRDLFEFDRIWAAAGAPDAVFEISPERLQEVTGGTVIDVK